MASFIISDVQIFTGETVIPRGSVLVRNGLIKQLIDSNDTLPSGVPVFSKPGHTVLPGLIDAHIHASGKDDALPLEQSMRFGVTTVMDMHTEPRVVAHLKKVANERSDVADFKAACLAATIDGGWPAAIVTLHDKSSETAALIDRWPKLRDPSEAESFVSQNVQDGADYIKLMAESGSSLDMKLPTPSLELQAALVNAAHSHGLAVVAHALSLNDTLQVLEAGVDGLTHCFFDKRLSKEVIAAYKKNNAWCNPTLVAIGSLTEEGKMLAEKYAHDSRVVGRLGQDAVERLCRCMSLGKGQGKAEFAFETVRKLHSEGVDIICGSDSAGPALGTGWGVSVHHELYLLVHEGGLTPQDALRSATSLTAQRFGFKDRGEIAEGRRADLLLVEGNPLQNIDDSLNIRGVWRGGIELK